jgi:hypothetical protein
MDVDDTTVLLRLETVMPVSTFILLWRFYVHFQSSASMSIFYSHIYVLIFLRL